jgi:predicted acetyltransferase
VPTIIRPVEMEELSEFARICSLSLAMGLENFEAMRPDWTLCAFEDDRLATCYGRWPFTMRFNGAPLPVAAVTTVSTLPIYRRRGHLRAIMDADFHLLHEQEGASIAILYASMAAIYQRFGYGIVSTHYSYRVEPRYLQFAHPGHVRGRLVEVTRHDSGLLNDLLKRFRADRTGDLHRSRAVWELGALETPPKDYTLSLLVYEEDGEPLGYVIYTSGQGPGDGGPGPRHAITVRDLIWLTPSAYRAIWEHLQRFDLARDVTWDNAPADDPLPHLLLEPRMLRATARDGILGRIVDLERALPVRPYGASGRLTFEVVDDMCPWNAGRWSLGTSGTETLVRRTTEDPDVTMPVHTLAMLVFGQLSATDAARMGRLDAHRPETLDLWDQVMKTKHKPYCGDHF